MLCLQLQLFFAFENILVSLVEFLLYFDVLSSCILQQRRQATDTLSVYFKISQHFFRVSVCLSAFLLLMVSLDTLQCRLHSHGRNFCLDLSHFLLKLIILALNFFCKNAGSSLVLQVLIGLRSQSLQRNLYLVFFKANLIKLTAQKLILLIYLCLNCGKVTDFIAKRLDFSYQTRI